MAADLYTQVKDLYAVITAKMTGKQVQSASAKGRQAAYAETPLKELIAFYMQLRRQCPEALADPTLPEVSPLDQPFATRGRPAVSFGRSWC